MSAPTIDEQVRAALQRVAAARTSGEAASPSDSQLLTEKLSSWELALEADFSRTRCSACRDSIAGCHALFHALCCVEIPAVARASRAELELRALGQLAHCLGEQLDCWADGAICTLATSRPFPRSTSALRREVNDALVFLLGPTGDFAGSRPPVHVTIEELCADRGAEARPISDPTTAVAVLEHVLDTRYCAGVLARGICPGCGLGIGAAQLVQHLTACPEHPEARRATKLEKRLKEIRGETPAALAGDVEALHRYRQALMTLLNRCEWLSSEFGWDGEAAYLDSWAENAFCESLTAARAVAVAEG